MPGTCFNGIWDCVHVLASELKPTGVMTCQLGDYKSRTVTETEAVVYGPGGMVSRPPNPDADGNVAEAIVLKDSWGDCVIGYRDFVGCKLAGQLQPGECCTYAAVGMARTLWKCTGNIVTYTTTTNDASGESIFVDVGPEGVKIGAPWGAATLTADGWQLGTKGGAALVLGADGSISLVGVSLAISCPTAIGPIPAATVPVQSSVGTPVVTPLTFLRVAP